MLVEKPSKPPAELRNITGVTEQQGFLQNPNLKTEMTDAS